MPSAGLGGLGGNGGIEINLDDAPGVQFDNDAPAPQSYAQPGAWLERKRTGGQAWYWYWRWREAGEDGKAIKRSRYVAPAAGR